MLVRACTAGVLGSLVVIVVVCLGAMAAPAPEPPLVLREVRASSTAVPPPGPAAEVSPTRTAASSRRARVVGAERDEVNLRAEPGTRGSRLKGLTGGTELELLGHEVETNGRTWRDVRDPTDGSEGWVAAEFLAPDR
jgi:SH3-like domain-containing protein